MKFDLFKYANVWGVGGKYRGDKGFSWFNGGALEKASKESWTKLLNTGMGGWQLTAREGRS